MVIIDVGHSKTTVSVIYVTNQLTKVVFSCSNRRLGGRDLDIAVAEDLCRKFLAENEGAGNPLNIKVAKQRLLE